MKLNNNSERTESLHHALEVNNLCKIYNSKSGKATILNALSFYVDEGEFVSVSGPNGCGKTTLMNILGGLDKEYDGTVTLYSEPPDPIKIGQVFQNYKDCLFPWMNLLDNVTFGLKMLNVPKNERHEKGKTVLQEMGLKDFHKYYPYQVSGGMNQKVSIGRALIGDSKLLLLDEPFSSLDQDTTFKLINDFIELWHRKPITTLLVSHDIDVSILLSDKIILLTPRPAEIIKIIKIPLSRPRKIDMLASQDFLELRNEIIAIGRHEGAFLK